MAYAARPGNGHSSGRTREVDSLGGENGLEHGDCLGLSYGGGGAV